MRLQFLLMPLIFIIGVAIGQKSIIIAYDPEVLENNALQYASIIFTAGCTSGAFDVTGKRGSYERCLELGRQVIKDSEEIIRNDIWNK